MEIMPYLTAAIMLLGILVGTLISPKIQHRVGTEYSRKDLLFKKKLEYFEKITETIEKNKKLYHNIIHKVEEDNSKKQIIKIQEELKTHRSKFSVMASPLYFNTKEFAGKIISFVAIEKDIFNKIVLLKEADKEKKEEITEQLKENLKRLKKKGEEILYEMKKELIRC